MRSALLLLLGFVFLVACGDSVTPRRDVGPPDDAPANDDAPITPTGDMDGDGLCDATEASRGTDPLSPDTDRDGFIDSAEVLLGFDPLGNGSPERERTHIMRETPEGALQVPIEVVVFGRGEDYTGAFESLGTPDLAGSSAAQFYLASEPVFAEPPDNVAFIDTEAEAFRAVEGRTLLGFEARFAFGDATPRVCNRAYLWRYNVKRSDGRLVSASRHVIVVLPPGATIAGGPWCLPEGGCI